MGKQYHLIAIGGAIMHNLAIALKTMGHSVSGSDDEIFDPAKSRLAQQGLLPDSVGWFPERIHQGLDAVILGMHAKADNPELLRAQELGIRVWSFPEFMYEHSKEKTRVVIAGSHGKTTITSMILHVLRSAGFDFDYLVGAKVQGFDTMVRLSDTAKLLVVEGDEYLASPIDRRPKFLLYHPHISLISGIAWDHINVFPTLESYHRPFQLLIETMPENSALVWNEEDEALRQIVDTASLPSGMQLVPYKTPPFSIRNRSFGLNEGQEWISLELMGRHNMQNLAGAWEVCKRIGLERAEFLKHIRTFRGAAGRLEKVVEDKDNLVIKDFAHSPSKVTATVNAVLELFGDTSLLAVLELHTFSSLNKNFLPEYAGSLNQVSRKIVYVDRHTLEHKGMPPVSAEDIHSAFQDTGIHFVSSAEELRQAIAKLRSGHDVFLMMSSGNFGGLDLKSLASPS